MPGVAAVTIAGSETDLSSQRVDDFASSLQGELILPGGQGYEAARGLWNGMIDRRPALIARCAGAASRVKSILRLPAAGR